MTNPFIQAAQPSGNFLKFKEVGTEHTLKIDSVTERQARDFYSKEPLFYPKSGDPIKEQWISGEYWDEDKEEVVDAVMVIDSKNKRKAIGEAMIAAEVTELQAGGVLKLKFTGYGQGANSANPPKEYEAEYTAPEPVGNPW